MIKTLLLILSFVALLVSAFFAFNKVTAEPERPSTFSESYVNDEFWLEPDNINIAHLNQKVIYEGEIMYVDTEFTNNGQLDKWEITYSYKDPNDITLYNTASLPNESLQEGIIYMQNLDSAVDYREDILTFNQFTELISDEDKKFNFYIEVTRALTGKTQTEYISLFRIQDAKE